jgi:hypothetical protein
MNDQKISSDTINSEEETLKNLKHKIAQEVMTDTEFNKLLSDRVKQTKTFADRKVEGIIPEVFIVGGTKKERKVSVLLIPELPEGEAKYGAMHLLGEKLVENDIQPVAIFMTSEAWMKKCSSLEEFDKSRSVSSYADKQEIAVVAGLTIDGRTNMAFMEMKRDKDKKIVALENEKVEKYKKGKDGSQANLLESVYRGYAYAYVKKNNPTLFESVMGKHDKTNAPTGLYRIDSVEDVKN